MYQYMTISLLHISAMNIPMSHISAIPHSLLGPLDCTTVLHLRATALGSNNLISAQKRLREWLFWESSIEDWSSEIYQRSYDLVLSLLAKVNISVVARSNETQNSHWLHRNLLTGYTPTCQEQLTGS